MVLEQLDNYKQKKKKKFKKVTWSKLHILHKK